METRRLGATGPTVSVLGLGGNNFGVRLDFEGTRAVVEAALEAGVTFFDTADGYGDGESERYLGRLLSERRDDVVVATKFGWGTGADDGVARGARAAIRASLNASLERLGMDYVDLYYYHRPDGVTPIAETLASLEELISEGLIRSYGLSNFNSQQLVEAAAAGRVAALQNEYNLLNRDDQPDLLRLCEANDIGFVPYRPLARGLLTGKYRAGTPPVTGRLVEELETIDQEVLARVDKLAQFATANGMTLVELSVAALVSQAPIASVLAGAMTPGQVSTNASAAERRLTPDDLARIDALDGRESTA
jgi:aryl-alcohol dehydrogenase-like predicted oxidoreductase